MPQFAANSDSPESGREISKQSAPVFPYVLKHQRAGKKPGAKLRVMQRGYALSQVQFDDGVIAVIGNTSIRRSKEFKYSVRKGDREVSPEPLAGGRSNERRSSSTRSTQSRPANVPATRRVKVSGQKTAKTERNITRCV